jgi:L-threonylcarbamoyladenylate synthase
MTATSQEREAGIQAAALAIHEGQLVVIPTDTVYGVPAEGQGAWP